MPKYYSKRNKPLDKDITLIFWRGVDAFIKEIIEKGWLSENFGSWSDYHERWYVEDERINRKMLQEIGFSFYPLNPGRMPSKEVLFDLIEFFLGTFPNQAGGNLIRQKVNIT